MTIAASPAEPTTAPDSPKTADPEPLRAVHTPNFPALLRRMGASLLVTTYQAGKLVLVRDEGDHLNTHFRAFQAPMGMALSGDRLAVGTKIQVWEFVDVPAVPSSGEWRMGSGERIHSGTPHSPLPTLHSPGSRPPCRRSSP